ncbi:hypothetical protein HDU67_004709 [Dinochytrium kinnereticum]|nr:hypothetical protein HDU67_004709 [Dinochytrium kinnereticum]
MIEPSITSLKTVKLPGRLMIQFLERLGLARVKRDPKTGAMVEVNNLTLLNLILVWGGPVKESQLATRLALVQIGCSVLGFCLRYGLAFLMY